MENGPKIVLVADDDENLRTLYGEDLKDDGYQVVLAQNGREVLEAVERVPIDLIVLDIVMPVMDGIEALGRIIARHKDIPVILYSAYPHYKDDFMSWAADAYLMKSSDLTELKEMIRHLLQKEKRGSFKSDDMKRKIPCEQHSKTGEQGQLQLLLPR